MKELITNNIFNPAWHFRTVDPAKYLTLYALSMTPTY